MENAQSKMENAHSEVDPNTVWRSKRAKIDTKYTGNANIVFFRIVLTPKMLRIQISVCSEYILMVKKGIHNKPFDAVAYCK